MVKADGTPVKNYVEERCTGYVQLKNRHNPLTQNSCGISSLSVQTLVCANSTILQEAEKTS